MDSLTPWVTVANTAGSVVVVVLFLWYLWKLRQSDDARSESRIETLKVINEDCHKHSERITERMEKASEKSNGVIERSSEVMTRVEKVLDKIANHRC